MILKLPIILNSEIIRNRGNTCFPFKEIEILENMPKVFLKKILAKYDLSHCQLCF